MRIRESRHRRPCLGQSLAQAVRVGADLSEDLWRSAHFGDFLCQRLRLLVEQVLRPLAELGDTGVSLAEFLRGVRDLVVVQLVEVERLGEVVAHGVERGTEVLGRALAQFCVREVQFIGRDPDPLIGLDQRTPRPACQFGVLRIQCGLLFTLAFAPESGHAPILSRVRSRLSVVQAIGVRPARTLDEAPRPPTRGGRPRRGRSATRGNVISLGGCCARRSRT